jgi:hypothetical protein
MNRDRFEPESWEDFMCRNKSAREIAAWRREQKRANGELSRDELEDAEREELWAEEK